VSGIVGIYFLDGRPVKRAELQGMVDILAHRGPDGAGVWHQGPVGLGHLMLHTTPESLKEKLPFASRTGNLVITADARIDNREELMAALGYSGAEAKEIADSELILAAYDKWGERCPEKLLGDFAFAIWDRHRGVLFCARDYIGIKPFYYFYRPGRVFVFASEIKALFCAQEVTININETRIADYIAGNLEDKSITFYRDILRLPPATSISVDPRQVVATNFWSPDPYRELHFNSEEDYVRNFLDIFTEAVRCRLRSAFPVGCLLSGGIDSSSVVGVARHLLNSSGQGTLQTFSAVYNEVPESDESPFINAVLAQGQVEPHFVHPDRLSPFMDLEQMMWHQDGLFVGPNLFMYWGGLYPAVQQCGVRVLLDGEDGDTTVGYGYGRLQELLWRGQLCEFIREIKRLAYLHKLSPWQVLWKWVIKPMIPKFISQNAKLLKRRLSRGPKDMMNPDFARRMHWAGRDKALQQLLPKGISPERSAQWLGLTSGLDSYSMELINKAAAPFAIEPRHPFYDRRLIEYCLALPSEQKLFQGWNRIVMRRAMAHLLPPEVCWRAAKGTLAPNFNYVLMAFERPLLEREIFHDFTRLQPYIDLDALSHAYRRYDSQAGGNYAVHVWLAVALSAWLKINGKILAKNDK